MRDTTSETNRDPSAIEVDRLIDCPFSLVLDEARLALPLFDSSAFVRFRLRDLGLPFGGNVTHRIVAHAQQQPDRSEPGRPHHEIAFTWSAPSWWLPRFHAVLRFRIERTQTRLSIVGRYHPPFGPAGWMFDRIIGHRLARATMSDLLDRLAIALEARWRDIKREAAAVEATHEPHLRS